MKNKNRKHDTYLIRDIIIEIERLRKKAKRNNKSLSGDNYYAHKFNELRCNLIKAKKNLELKIESTAKADLKDTLKSMETDLELVTKP